MPDLDLDLQDALDMDFAQFLGEQGLEELKQQDLSPGQGSQHQQIKLDLAKSSSLDSSTIALSSLPELCSQPVPAAGGAVAVTKGAAKASKPRALKPKKAAKSAATAAPPKAQGGVAKPPRKLTITLKKQSQQQQHQKEQVSQVPLAAGAAVQQLSAGIPCPVATPSMAGASAALVVGSPDSGSSSGCDLTAMPLSPLGMSEEESGSIGQFSLLDDVMADINFGSICGVDDSSWDDILNL
jgi:hypothetical protein